MLNRRGCENYSCVIFWNWVSGYNIGISYVIFINSKLECICNRWEIEYCKKLLCCFFGWNSVMK